MTRYLAGTVCLALAATALTACSSSGGGAPAPPAGSLSASVAAAAPASDGGSAIDPCTVVTVADVQPLITPKLGKTKASTQPLLKANDLHLCTYLSTDGNEEVTLSAYVNSAAANTYTEFRQSEDSPTDVPGVGDKAYRGDENAEVTAVHGNVMCIVDVSDAGDVPGADRLYDENGHHTDIGAPAFDVIAKALGTLCNRIFGVGTTTPDLSGLAGLHPPAPTS